jgi:DedD protein
METAVKERLVGGAVLVLLVVLVVPALLSGPRQPPPPEPDSEGSTRTVEIDISGPRPTVDAVAEPPADRPVLPSPSGLPEPAASSVTPDVPVAPTVAAEPTAGSSVEPVSTAPATLEEPAAPGSAWAVQLAALSNADSARKMVAELSGHGYAAFILEYRSNGRVLYRVRVGPEAQRERAAALAERLQGEGYKATVVAHP